MIIKHCEHCGRKMCRTDSCRKDNMRKYVFDCDCGYSIVECQNKDLIKVFFFNDHADLYKQTYVYRRYL